MPKKLKVELFKNLRQALQDAAAYERGESVNLRVTGVPSLPKQISTKKSAAAINDPRASSK
jgi:hypothetical protein